MLGSIDLAWAGGIYEGEGYVAALRSRRHSKPHAVVAIDQKDRWVLDRLAGLFGGTVKGYNKKTNSARNPDERRMYYRWTIGSTRALGFIQTIFPILSPRRQAQIERVLHEVTTEAQVNGGV